MGMKSMGPIVDYLVVIPLDEEFRYVRSVIESRLIAGIRANTIGAELYGKALVPTAAGSVSVVILSVGRMTEAPVQSAVEAAARTWRPADILMVGIAGSLEPDKVRLGDVIVPSRIFGYTEGKAEIVDGKSVITYRPTGDRVDCELAALARAVHHNDVKAWRAASRKAGLTDAMLKPKLLTKEGKEGPKLHIDNNDCIASGNTVVATRVFAQEIRRALGTTVKAVEMEAKGLCEALAKIKPTPSALIVRGISDLADEEKAALEKASKDGWRRYAAQNAARFVLNLITSRPAIAEGYRRVAVPTYSLLAQDDSAAQALSARINAREVGMRNVVFRPFMACDDGLPTTDLTLEARRGDGSSGLFSHILLRHSDDKRIVLEVRDVPSVRHRLERTGEPAPLELLIGLPEGTVAVELMATDEFGRNARAAWPRPAE